IGLKRLAGSIKYTVCAIFRPNMALYHNFITHGNGGYDASRCLDAGSDVPALVPTRKCGSIERKVRLMRREHRQTVAKREDQPVLEVLIQSIIPAAHLPGRLLEGGQRDLIAIAVHIAPRPAAQQGVPVSDGLQGLVQEAHLGNSSRLRPQGRAVED